MLTFVLFHKQQIWGCSFVTSEEIFAQLHLGPPSLSIWRASKHFFRRLQGRVHFKHWKVHACHLVVIVSSRFNLNVGNKAALKHFQQLEIKTLGPAVQSCSFGHFQMFFLWLTGLNEMAAWTGSSELFLIQNPKALHALTKPEQEESKQHPLKKKKKCSEDVIGHGRSPQRKPLSGALPWRLIGKSQSALFQDPEWSGQERLLGREKF